MERILHFVTERAGWTLAVLTVTAALAVLQIVDARSGTPRLELDPSIDRLLPDEDEDRRFYDRVRRIFGSDETLVVALVADDLFTAENLRRVARISRRLATLPAVQRVVSLDNALHIRSQRGDLLIEPFIETVPEDPAALARIRREALDNPIYAGNLVSRDGRAAAIVVYLRDMPERELLGLDIDRQVLRIAREESGDAQVWLAGGLYLKAETGRLMMRDLSRTLPLAALVVVAVALVCFRSLAGVLVPVGTTLLALVWTLGIASALGHSLNLVTAVAPSIVLVVGFAYAVHVVCEYEDVLREDRSSGSPVSVALRQIALPVALTGATTAVGFLSLATSPLSAVRQFGLLCTLGVAATLVASLSFAPAVLAQLPRRRARPPSAASRRFDALAERVARFDTTRRIPILVAAALVAALAAWGSGHIRVSSDFLRDFPPTSEVRRNVEAVNRNLEGGNTFYVVLEARERDAFKEPENLRSIRELQRWLEARAEIGGTTSHVDYLMLIHRGFNDNDPAFLTIPDSRRLVTQLLFFGANEEIERFVDAAYQTAAIAVRSTVFDSGELADLVERVEARLDDLPAHIEGHVTGNGVLVARSIDDIARGQATSLSLAFGVIFVILALLFTSLRVGFIALIPNALPVLVYFGVLGWTGVTLNSTTGLVACIVLGIAVDDTIHFLARFNAEARRRADEAKGVVAALRRVGRPVTYTSAALCLGFLVLTTSELRNQVEFGALAAFTLAFAWLVDVVFTPALALRMRIVTLWDALTLDLGEAPHHSIPLFAGLSKTQARVAALMASIETFPEGHTVFRAGEMGQQMYVVIEGRLAASMTGREGTVRFGELCRGAAVGEVALFHGRRTADVRAVTDVRLLRLSRRSLERLRRRYPRIGAQLYANLSAILADRVASTTQALR